MVDVVFYEIFHEEKIFIKRFLSKSIKAEFYKGTILEEGHKIPPAPLISIRTQSRVPVGWAGHVSGILTRSQGYDHIVSFREKAQRKIPYGYLGDYSSRSVAEHAIMAMLVLQKRLREQIKNFYTFDRDNLTGANVLGKNVLVVGVGNIGRQLVDILKGLRMNVFGVDIVRRNKGLKYVSLKEGVKAADVIFCALPLTEKTNRLLNFRCLRNVKKGCIFVNVSRGEISPTEDLKRLLDQKILGGLSLDVFSREEALARSLRKSKRSGRQAVMALGLSKRLNVLFTPHNAFNTRECVERKSFLTARSVERFLRTGRFPKPVEGE